MRIKLDKGAKMPTRAHDTDAGLDLYAMHGGLIRAGRTATFHTGVHVELPHHIAGILLPKSGLMLKHDLLTFGVVDEGYSGEIMVHVFNLGVEDYMIWPEQKISQLITAQVIYEPVEIVDDIGGGERGDAGFGSTGG